MNKNYLVFGFMGVFVMAFAAAALVPYLSNTVTTEFNVDSPITIDVNGEELYTFNLYAGESEITTSTTTVHVEGVTGHIAELKILNFDGQGISVDYEVAAYPGVFKLNGCQVNGNTYYYIGDPSEELSEGSFESTTTFNTAFDLDTSRSYSVETKVIVATTAACTPSPAYEFVAN